MLSAGELAPALPHDRANQARLLVFLETDCPTCRLTIPYLNKLTPHVVGISQDSDCLTKQLVEQSSINFPVDLDPGLALSRAYDPTAVPALFLIGADNRV